MKCLQRNCEKIFKDKSNKKFCCKSCKNKEAVYRGRDKNKLKSEKTN